MGKKIYFLSDLHLGADYRKDKSGTERKVVDFLNSIRHDAEAVYLMGDILDYWFEYRTAVPRGYIRFFGALASLADAGVRIVWYIGNHDIWLFDYLRDEIGIEVVDGWRVEEILGKRFFLNHGDGVGRRDLGFRIIRGIFRNKICQKLYSGIHPRWTIPFAHRWSSHSRKSGHGNPYCNQTAEELPLVRFASSYLKNVDPTINYFVFGHLHILLQHPLSHSCQLIVLGDWINHFSYGTFDGKEFSLHTYKDECAEKQAIAPN